MKYGYGWVIQNCTITNSRNNGISMGVSDEVFFSRTLIYAHNLFYQSPFFELRGVPDRPFVLYYKPHSTELAGRNEAKLRHQRWYNNIFIGDTIRKIPKNGDNTSGFLVDNNIYLDGAFKFPFEGDKRIMDTRKTSIDLKILGYENISDFFKKKY